MITGFAILPYAVIALVGAFFQADEHAPIIRRGRMTDKVKRDWVIGRIAVLGLLAVGVSLIGMVTPMQAVVLAVGAWCVWTTIFRYRLNAAMQWDEHYIGASSDYDLFMISLVLFCGNLRWPRTAGIRATHDGAYQHSARYRETVHTAGKMAGILEMSVASLAAVMTYL